MTDRRSADLPCVVLFNINGSGMGHLSTCLAYANRLRGRARPVFFSLASAIEFIEEMGFEADYFVSRFWSRANSWAWDRQLAEDIAAGHLDSLADEALADLGDLVRRATRLHLRNPTAFQVLTDLVES